MGITFLCDYLVIVEKFYAYHRCVYYFVTLLKTMCNCFFLDKIVSDKLLTFSEGQIYICCKRVLEKDKRDRRYG